MTKKILAVILALVMAIGGFSVLALADEADANVTPEGKAAAWNENLAPVLAQLIRNESSSNWKYVAENNKELSDTMLTYTVFALYDDAWKNGFDKSVSVENAEEILVSLIEKIDANIGESKFAEVLSVLQTASDFNDLLQKVNGYVKISDTLTSNEWTTAFKYINYAIKIGNLYMEARDEVIEAYARIISVQAANELYKDFLEYVASTTDYDVVVTACNELINDIETSVDELISDEVLKATGFTASNVLTTAARIAMDTNAYTAVALKVYDIGVSAADVLWNTSDQYKLMDQLYTTFYVETAASSYAKIAAASGNDDLYVFAIGALLALREAGAETLYNLKLAQNQGIVGMIKDQINYNVTINEAAELAFLALAKEVLFNTDVETYIPVDSILQVNTVATVKAGNTSLQAATAEPVITNDGYFSVAYNDAARTLIKTGFVAPATDVVISSDKDTLVTAIVDVIVNGNIEDFSFTTIGVSPEKTISFNTAFADGYTFELAGAEESETYYFSDEYVYPALNAVTASSVANAVVNVAKDQAGKKIISIGDAIKAFFDNILKTISNLINSIKLFKK